MSMSESYSNRTITAFFDTRDDAQSAIDRLKGLGLSDGSVKLVRGDDENFTSGEDNRGFWESLSDFFFPDDDRAAYAEGLRRGGFLVTATDIPSDRYSEALDILDDEGSVDVDARSETWRSEGWTAPDYADRDAMASDYATAGTGVASAYGAGLSPAARDDNDRATRSSAGETDIGGTATVGSASTSADRDTWRDDATLSDEAAASSTAPVGSDATRLDSSYAGSTSSFDADREAARDASTPYGTMGSSASAFGTDRRTARDASANYGAAGSASAADRTLSADGDTETIPVMEEKLRVAKRDTNLGRVRVRSYVVEEPVSEDVNLRNERVSIERRPVDRPLSASDEQAFTDRVIEAEEHTEEAVVSKEARVKEEIALRKQADERTETVSDTIRHTEVEVEDERNNATGERITGTDSRMPGDTRKS